MKTKQEGKPKANTKFLYIYVFDRKEQEMCKENFNLLSYLIYAF
jgi:hypothetical protein